MDLFDLLLHLGLISAGLVAFLLFRTTHKVKGNYIQPGWVYYLKLPCAYYFIKKWKKKQSVVIVDEQPSFKCLQGATDDILVQTSSPDGATAVVGMRKRSGRPPVAEVTVYVKLADGTEYFLPRHPDPIVGRWQDETSVWRCGGLTIQILETNKRLRILFDGVLKRLSDGELQHVKFNLIWAAATRVFRHPLDWSDELAARALALQLCHGDSWETELNEVTDPSTCQFGAAQGRIQTRDHSGNLIYDEYIRTRGACSRKISSNNVRREMTLTVAATDGTALQFNAASYAGKFTECFSGHVRMPNFTSWGITSTDLIMSDFCETPDAVPDVYTVHVGTKERQLKLILRINKDGGHVYSGFPYTQETHYRTVHVDINGYIGTGILKLCYKIDSPITPLHPTNIPVDLISYTKAEEVGAISYCAKIGSKVASCPSIVGGKGASLSLLALKQEEMGYKVPPGFCVTYTALDKHLESNPAIIEAIRNLEAATVNYDESVFKQKCEKVVELFGTSVMPTDVSSEVLQYLDELEKTSMEQKYGPDLVYAVRSSAVGEDSSDLSAAGQNATVLGCGAPRVVDSIVHCWGQMYSFNSVYYRRRNGQQCRCRGSVTVQSLVHCKSAGVMFTVHDSPNRLLIAANYGLGESVVSGSAEPDTFIIRRDLENNLSIDRIEVGGKAQRVVMSQNGVETVDVSGDSCQKACLSEEETLKLAKLGVQQEIAWGAPRDIEWGIVDGQIYLLQARPITSIDRWSEEELLHEVDMPIMSDDELLTFANTGEVMPKPLSALTYDLISSPLDLGIRQQVGAFKNEDSRHGVAMTHYRICIPLFNSIYQATPAKIDFGIRVMELALHGRMVADDHVLSVAVHRKRPSPFDKLLMIKAGRFLLSSKSWMNACVRKVTDLHYSTDSNNLSVLLDNIVQSHANKDVEYLCACHAATTAGSVMSQIIAMSILMEGQSDFTLEQCAEVSTILSCGDVVSADVPQALANICRLLEKSGQYETFRQIDPLTAMDWLKENLPSVRQQVDAFLEQHGHRAIMEFDLSTKPWSLVPEQMMKVLQTMTLNSEEVYKHKTIAEVVAALKTPKKPFTRNILSWVLPLCQRLVRQREYTKSHLILGVHKLRLAVLALGREMVKQWYLPQVELVFHFRLHELKEFVKTRDPVLLRKAYQRYQYISSWSSLKFAELQFGWPAPEQLKVIEFDADASVRGTGVCGGDVVARACVLSDLADISTLQKGDVLITRSTDIGWSPYFPLLAGVVTELGGLISHGAVIAREYGLPCVVGATDAMSIFSTGDMVRLSATKGLIERVQVKN